MRKIFCFARRWAGLPPCGRQLSGVSLEIGSSGVVKLHQYFTFRDFASRFISAEGIKARCSSILNDKALAALVEKSGSPSAAYEMVFAETKDISKAKAGRWLAVLRRDYPAEYRKLIPNPTSYATNGTAQKEKEK